MKIPAQLMIVTLGILGACTPKERPDELQLMSDDVLKHKRGIVIDIEPGKAEQ